MAGGVVVVPGVCRRPRARHGRPMSDDPAARVVAIDGPSGSGKSTIAGGVACRLDLPVLDTGAMYRAIALAAIEAGVDLYDEDASGQIARERTIAVESG